MPWYWPETWSRQQPAPSVPKALTAAAAIVPEPRAELMRSVDAWQNEAWSYYDRVGEYRYAISWFGQVMSRVRLRAGKLAPGQDEPEIVDSGTAAELVAEFGGGVTGKAQMLKSLAVQYSVPGECYVVGEEINGVEHWCVRSMDEVRAQSGKYQVVENRIPSVEWRDLPDNSVPIRMWQPHERYYHVADSPSRAALSSIRELELVNRHITAQYLSRVAMAGVILFPDELDLPVREEFEEQANGFVLEWMEIAAEGIKNPGAASAIVPIPIRGPAEFLDAVKHVDFTLKIDDKIIEKRESVIKRLASQLNMPAEILLGMGDVNHWSAWQLEEGALKVHVAPYVEQICHDLTLGYLQPRLKASGVEDWQSWVFWYDLSELALRPDRSQQAFEAYDRLEISGEALRREAGFGESDKPTADQLVEQGLKAIVMKDPANAPKALAQLTGTDIEAAEAPETETPEDTVSDGPAPAEGPDTGPPNGGAPPGAEDEPGREAAEAERVERLLRQSQTAHFIRMTAVGAGSLLHPPLCSDHLYSCPYTMAMRRPPSVLPGTSGLYMCHLTSLGAIAIDGPASYVDASSYLTTRSNGYALT